MSETPTDLMAFYPEGRCKVGELSVDEMPIMPKNLMLAPLVKTVKPCLKAIEKADLIILGPGSFLTSVIPPLLVRDISNAIKASKGRCVFIDNVVAEQSPAAQISLDEKLVWIKENTGNQPVEFVVTQDDQLTSAYASIVCQPLASSEVAHHHSQDKLVAALNACVELFDQPNSVEQPKVQAAQ